MVAQAEVITYEYLPKQLEFMQNVDEVPHAGYIGGFGSGKTHTLCVQSMREIQVPSRGLIGASTYRMLEDTTQRKFFELCPPQWIKKFRKSSNTVEFVNGSEVLFRNLENPGRLASLELDWFGLDEIGEVKLETFRMLQGRLRRRGGRHKGFGVGNPAGPAHWTYEYFVDKAATYPHMYRLTQAPSTENTFLPQHYIEGMTVSFDVNSVYYKRYVLGEFCAFEGAYWANFRATYAPQGHIYPYEKMLDLFGPLEQASLTWGKVLDFGFQNPFVCLWYVTNGKKIIFYDEYYQRHRTIQEHCLEIQRRELEHQQLFRAPKLNNAYTDHDAQCRHEIANCKNEHGEAIGFNCVPADKKVLEGILLVQTLFSQNMLYISDRCDKSRREISSYRSKDNSPDEKPLKEDDHTCDAVRMACQMEMAHMLPWLRYKDVGYALQHDVDNLSKTIDHIKTVHPEEVAERFGPNFNSAQDLLIGDDVCLSVH